MGEHVALPLRQDPGRRLEVGRRVGERHDLVPFVAALGRRDAELPHREAGVQRAHARVDGRPEEFVSHGGAARSVVAEARRDLREDEERGAPQDVVADAADLRQQIRPRRPHLREGDRRALLRPVDDPLQAFHGRGEVGAGDRRAPPELLDRVRRLLTLALAEEPVAVRRLRERAQHAHVTPRGLAGGREPRGAAGLHERRRRHRDVDQATVVRRRRIPRRDLPTGADHEVPEGFERLDGIRLRAGQDRRKLRAEGRVLQRRDLRAERGVVEAGQLLDLGDELVDLRAERAGRLRVAVRRELRNQRRGELVVGGVAEGLEAPVGLLDADRERPDLLDLALVVAYVVAALELIGQEVVLGVVELGGGEIALEEARRGGRLVLGAGEPAVCPHLGQLVPGVRLGKVLLEDVAADEVVVIQKRVPLREVAREEVCDPHALATERLRPGGAVGGAVGCVGTTGARDATVDLDGMHSPVPTHAVVVAVRSLELPEAEREVVLEIRPLCRGELRRLERGGAPGEGDRRDDDRPCEPRAARAESRMPVHRTSISQVAADQNHAVR